jgi:glutamate-ammonia-ligase adenylyltransferase
VTEEEVETALSRILSSEEASRLAPEVARLPDPDGAIRDLERLRRSAGPRFAPGRAGNFLVVAGWSPYLANLLIQNPEFLEALPSGAPSAGLPTREDLEEDLARFRFLHSDADVSTVLRWFRNREYPRIALADFLGAADLPTITGALSLLADVLLDSAVRAAGVPLEERYGRPTSRDDQGLMEGAGFVVLALGKLGGQELNYSSDIDLMYLFSRDGETTGPGKGRGGTIGNKEYFTRLASDVTRLIAGHGPEGQVFRVDLGLRPGGNDGELVASMGAAVAYYRNWAEPWERQALIKARPAAGDLALGQRFVRQVNALVYPPEPDPYLTLEIAAMKDRIDARLSDAGTSESDIKLGRGGIRELEFAVQALQLRHGGRDPWLQQGNTLLALHRLAEKGFIAHGEYGALAEAYVFLRNLEHRLQLGWNRRASLLPSRAEDWALLARRMGLQGPGPEAAASRLSETLERHRAAARRFFDSVVREAAQPRIDEEGPDLWLDRLDDGMLLDRLAASGIAEPLAVLGPVKRIRRLLQPAAVSLSLRRALRRAGPALLKAAGRSVDARRAFANLEKLLSSLADDRDGLLRFFARQDVLEPVVRLLGKSDLLGDLLIRQPAILDELGDRGRLLKSPDAGFYRSLLEPAVLGPGDARARAGELRRRHQAALALIAIRDINGQATLREVLKSLSALADAAVDSALGLAAEPRPGTRERGSSPAPAIAALGLGRLGYREMDYGSDLDLVFLRAGLGDDPAEAQAEARLRCERAVRLLTTLSRDGQLYQVDLRLRPSGREGNIVATLDALCDYFSLSADVWEMQSFLKARPVAGEGELGGRAARQVEDLILARCRDLGPGAIARAVHGMRRRLIEKEPRDPDRPPSIKLGPGGLLDIHFVIEFLQLAHGVPSPPDKDTLRLLTHLGDLGFLKEDPMRDLYGAYLFLRALDHQIRLIHNRPRATLPVDVPRLAEIARAIGDAPDDNVSAADWLRESFAERTAAVRQVYEEVVAGACA